MTDERDIAEAQELAALLHAQGAPITITIQGEPHTPKRIMFWHGATTGHASCACPITDEHGHNVNPGRRPLERKAAGREEGSRKASETFARRRARKCADELAVIDPSLWDSETRRIVLTLATVAAPSRIDDVLAGELPATLDELDRLVARLDADEIVVETVSRPEPRPYPQPRPRPDPDPRPRPEPHPSPDAYDRAAIAEANERNDRVHDNGDYRA